MSVRRLFTCSSCHTTKVLDEREGHTMACPNCGSEGTLEQTRVLREKLLQAHDLAGASLHGVTFMFCSFDEMDLSRTSFGDAGFFGCQIQEAQLGQVDLTMTAFRSCDLSETKVDQVRLAPRTFAYCVMVNSDLPLKQRPSMPSCAHTTLGSVDTAKLMKMKITAALAVPEDLTQAMRAEIGR